MSVFTDFSATLSRMVNPVLRYAIGDVHGRCDLLAQLLERVQADRRGRPAEIIFLGDYIDRGPDSAGVLEDLSHRTGFGDADVTCLKGNHEAVLLQFLDDASVGAKWAQFGGLDTIASYGIRPPATRLDAAGWETLREELAAAIPAHHLDFLRSLETLTRRDQYLFVHAGIDPTRPIQVQDDSDFLWIRKPFHKRAHTLKFTVVHGHSATTRPIRKRGRICVDTGAHSTGHLTAARLRGSAVKFLST